MIRQHTLTDRDGDTTQLWTMDRGRIFVTVGLGDETHTAGSFTRAQGLEALDAVAPAGSYARTDEPLGAYERHESPDYADGGVAAALIEKEAEQSNAEVRELRSALAREIERGNALQDALDAAVSRPLTPDAITDEMVERARNAPSFDGRLSPTPGLVREMLTAALTEPLARPEWADLEDVLDAGWPEGINGAKNGYIARTLHEGGVRVVGEEQS